MIELRELNFDRLISVGVPDVSSYSYDEYRNNGYEHKPIDGYCISCEEKGCNISTNDDSYKLTNISHGAHSDDFFLALEEKPDTTTTDWHHEPIIFVYETPSSDYGIYKDIPPYNGYNKRPAKDWYWIRKDWAHITYPEGFKGGVYGEFVWSATLTFKLAKVYMTNLVKCGLNNAEGKFKGLTSFKNETVENCHRNFLSKEISIIKPKIIFAVGSKTEWWVNHFVKDKYFVQQLPHPAGKQRGFRDDHYRAIYFWGVARGLHKAGIINTDESCELAKLYLDDYDLPGDRVEFDGILGSE